MFWRLTFARHVVARVTLTPVGAVGVDALLLARDQALRALVDVLARDPVALAAISRAARALERPRVVITRDVLSEAHSACAVTLVDVKTPVVMQHHKYHNLTLTNDQHC